MKVEIQINNSASPEARYVTWAPSPCRIRVSDPTGIIGQKVSVRLEASSRTGGGTIALAAQSDGRYGSSLTVSLLRNGTSVPFFVRGVFGKPSSADRDVTIEARAKVLPARTRLTLVGSVALMVRVRKNANDLTAGERSRVAAAFATLNNQGLGRFSDFREMHVNQSSAEAHGRPG